MFKDPSSVFGLTLNEAFVSHKDTHAKDIFVLMFGQIFPRVCEATLPQEPSCLPNKQKLLCVVVCYCKQVEQLCNSLWFPVSVTPHASRLGILNLPYQSLSACRMQTWPACWARGLLAIWKTSAWPSPMWQVLVLSTSSNCLPSSSWTCGQLR